ncbi:MAG: lipoate--protein ligase family protein [Candidatus Rifleibacteriota bacterium]
MNNIRLIISEPASGSWNMAVDETLAQSLSNRPANYKAFIRFYQWNPATLSFGYNQPIAKLIKTAEVEKAGYGIVKRSSGGKMVFHNHEWTFSLGFMVDDLKKKKKSTFLEMFTYALEPLLNGLQKLEIPARFSDNKEIKRGINKAVHCYAAAAGHSIFAGEQKLIGAAGIVRKGVMSIHGSIPVEVSFPDSKIFFGNRKIDDGVSMTCLADFLDQEKIKTLPELIATEYEKFSQDKVIKSKLSVEEIAIAKKLVHDKYSLIDWKEKQNKLKVTQL